MNAVTFCSDWREGWVLGICNQTIPTSGEVVLEEVSEYLKSNDVSQLVLPQGDVLSDARY